MVNEGMMELLVLYVLANKGRAVGNGRGHWLVEFGEESIICTTPQSEWEWLRLISDLRAAGLPWPPISG